MWCRSWERSLPELFKECRHLGSESELRSADAVAFDALVERCRPGPDESRDAPQSRPAIRRCAPEAARTRHDGGVLLASNGPLDTWDHWVGQLEQRPLDREAYGQLLQARSDLGDVLEVSGREDLWKSADKIDHRFNVLTERVRVSPFAAEDRIGWWWNRLPLAKKYRAYLEAT